MAWARAHERAADPVERAQQAGAQRLDAGPADRRAERLADPDEPEQHAEHDDRPDDGSSSSSRSGVTAGRTASPSSAASDRARRGRRAGAARPSGRRASDRDHDQDDREQVQGVHRRIVPQVRGWGVSAGRSPSAHAPAARLQIGPGDAAAGAVSYSTSSVIAWASPSAGDRSTCRRASSPRSTTVALSSAISMHITSPRPSPR